MGHVDFVKLQLNLLLREFLFTHEFLLPLPPFRVGGIDDPLRPRGFPSKPTVGRILNSDTRIGGGVCAFTGLSHSTLASSYPLLIFRFFGATTAKATK